MQTILLTWNPSKNKWKYAEELAEKCAHTNSPEFRWSVVRKDIQELDRFFLLRQGSENSGIVGGGYFVSGVESGPHWDKDKGGELRYARIVFEWLNPEVPLVQRETLLSNFCDQEWNSWDVQQSGVRLPDQIAELLEQQISGILENTDVYYRLSEPPSIDVDLPEFETQEGKTRGMVESCVLE